MPKAGYHTDWAYADDISFGRLFLGMGPKITKQPNKPKVIVPAVKQASGPPVLEVEGKMYTVVDIKKAVIVAPPAAAAPPPPTSPNPPAPVETPASESQVTAPEPSAAPEPVTTADPATNADATVEVPAWTDVQDALLLGLKTLNKTWKEIGVLVEGKDTEDLRERYAELKAVGNKGKKQDEVKTPSVPEEDTEERNEGDKKKDKKDKKNKKDGKGQEVTGNTKKDKQGKDKQLKGILKPDDADQEESDEVTLGPPNEDGEYQMFRGHRVVFVDTEDDISPREFMHLFNFRRRLEQDIWLQLSSKLFDKTGKRVSPEFLKVKFKDMGLL